jgi:hypothetical protein
MAQSSREVFQSVKHCLSTSELHSRILATETAIFDRLQELSGSSNSTAERHEIEQALEAIRKLQVARLHDPDIGSDHLAAGRTK